MILQKNKVLLLAETQLKLHQDSRVCYICRKEFTQKLAKYKHYCKVRDHCHFACKYRGAAVSIYNLRSNLSNNISVVFLQWIKVWLSYYDKNISKKVQRWISMSWGIEKEIGKNDKDSKGNIITLSKIIL